MWRWACFWAGNILYLIYTLILLPIPGCVINACSSTFLLVVFAFRLGFALPGLNAKCKSLQMWRFESTLWHSPSKLLGEALTWYSKWLSGNCPWCGFVQSVCLLSFSWWVLRASWWLLSQHAVATRRWSQSFCFGRDLQDLMSSSREREVL